MPKQDKFFLLCLWGVYDSCTPSDHNSTSQYFPLRQPTFIISNVKSVIRINLGHPTTVGNTRVANYKACIKRLLRTYGVQNVAENSLSPFTPQLFPSNLGLGAVSDEHGERFHQDIMKMEANYRGKWSPSMMGDFSWMLKRDIPNARYRRSSRKNHF